MHALNAEPSRFRRIFESPAIVFHHKFYAVPFVAQSDPQYTWIPMIHSVRNRLLADVKHRIGQPQIQRNRSSI